MNSSMRAVLSLSWTVAAFATLLLVGLAKSPLFQETSSYKHASLLSYEAHPLFAKERMCLSKESSLP